MEVLGLQLQKLLVRLSDKGFNLKWNNNEIISWYSPGNHLHSHRTPNQLDPLLKLPSSPSVPSLRRKYPNFSSPAILQHVL